MNNTSNSDSKAKIIVIIASLIVILAIALALTFILKSHQNTEVSVNDTQQNTPKDIKTTIQDNTSKESIPEEVGKTSDKAEQAGDMNGDTTTGVEITDEMKEYNESPESAITEEDNTAEEPKQEEVYVPAAEPEVDNTPSTPEASVDNTPASSGSDDSFWSGSGDVFSNTTEGDENGWGDTTGWTWQ